MKASLKEVKVPAFDGFDTVVDWRASIIAEGRPRGCDKPPNAMDAGELAAKMRFKSGIETARIRRAAQIFLNITSQTP